METGANNMDDILIVVLLIATGGVVQDYGRTVHLLFKKSKSLVVADPSNIILSSFLRGFAYYNLNVVLFASYWVGVVVLSSAIDITGWALAVVVGVYCILCVASVTGKRKWFDTMIRPILNDYPIEKNLPKEVEENLTM